MRDDNYAGITPHNIFSSTVRYRSSSSSKEESSRSSFVCGEAEGGQLLSSEAWLGRGRAGYQLWRVPPVGTADGTVVPLMGASKYG